MVMCFDVYPEAGGLLGSSECLSYLLCKDGYKNLGKVGEICNIFGDATEISRKYICTWGTSTLQVQLSFLHLIRVVGIINCNLQ